MNGERIQDDNLRRTIQEKLRKPEYQLELISKYKSNIKKFRLGILLGIVFLALMVIMGSIYSYILDGVIKKLFPYAITVIFFALYYYLASKYYRCPACQYKLNIYQSSPKGESIYSDLESCPRCGAPFREIANPSGTPNTHSISKTTKYLLLIAFLLICLWCIIRFG